VFADFQDNGPGNQHENKKRNRLFQHLKDLCYA